MCPHAQCYKRKEEKSQRQPPNMKGAWNAFDDIANKYFERHFANSMISSTWNILFAPSFELLAHRFSYGIQFLRFGQAKCHSCIAFIYRHFIYADYRILFEWPFYYIATRFHRDKTPSFIRQKEREKKEHSSPIRYTPFAVLFAATYFVYHVHINFCISSIFMPYQMILAFHYNPYVCHRIEQMHMYPSYVCIENCRYLVGAFCVRQPVKLHWWAVWFLPSYSYLWCLFAC